MGDDGKDTSSHLNKGGKIEYPYHFKEEKRKKAKIYSKQKLYIGFFQGTIVPLIILLILHFTMLSRSLENVSQFLISSIGLSNYWLIAALFVVLFIIITFIIGLPISFYSGYKLEHKYHLSNQDISGWIREQIKSLGLALLLTTPIIVGVFYMGKNFQDWWWLYAGVIYFAILGLLTNISHLIFLPLFYELEELKDKELSKRLIEMAHKHGVPEVKKVVKVKAGEKTEKANASFAGMGKTKRIYLFDTLLDKFHDKEIEGVVAHEMGHYVNKDIWRSIMIQGVTIFPILFLTGRFFNSLASFEHICNLPLFLLIIYGLYSIIDPIIMAHSRYRERKADSFSLDVVEDPDAVVSTFKRLSDIDLAELDPKKMIEILFYSHPSPKERIQMAEEYRKNR